MTHRHRVIVEQTLHSHDETLLKFMLNLKRHWREVVGHALFFVVVMICFALSSTLSSQSVWFRNLNPKYFTCVSHVLTLWTTHLKPAACHSQFLHFRFRTIFTGPNSRLFDRTLTRDKFHKKVWTTRSASAWLDLPDAARCTKHLSYLNKQVDSGV